MKSIFRFGSILLLTLAMPLLVGCNNHDDVEGIFTDKTWKMTFIALEGQTKQFDFWNGDDNARRLSMERLGKENNFNLNFEGNSDDSLIKGTFSGRGVNTTVSGSWSANGENNALSFALSKTPTESDVLGKAFLNGLKNAFRYEGDINHLYIYYKDGQTTKFMAFVPLSSQ